MMIPVGAIIFLCFFPEYIVPAILLTIFVPIGAAAAPKKK
jgi:hypothetical protein